MEKFMNRYWQADEKGTMVLLRGRKDLENVRYEKEAEGEMAMEMQNSHWKADEEGTMILLRGRKDLENFGYEKVEMQNSHWKDDEEATMVLLRGRKEEKADAAVENVTMEDVVELTEDTGPRSGMEDFGDEDEEEDIGEEDKEEDIGDEREEDKAEEFVFPSLISEEEDIGEEDKEEKNPLTKQEEEKADAAVENVTLEDVVEVTEDTGPRSGMDDFGDEDEEEDIGDEREEDKAEDFVFPSLISEEEDIEDEEEDIGEEDKEEKNRLIKQEANIDNDEVDDDSRDTDYRPSDGEEEVEEGKQKAKRRAATKKHRETKLRRVECKVEGCKDLVVNISRHMRLCHPDIVKDSPVIPIETKEMAFLDICLNDFKKQVSSRRNSASRSTGTVDSHLTGIRFFLSELSSDRILQLGNMGDVGGVIDRELEKATRLPGTIRLYLASLIKFLEWVSGSSTWLRHLRLSSSVVLTLCRSLVNVKGTLSEDVNADKVARKAAGQQVLDLEPWMVARYLMGSRPMRATCLLQEASGRVLRTREALGVRDSLCLQLVLGNAKRGGDITHIRADNLDRVEIQKGYGELVVYEHKEARSGKSCYVRVTARLQADLVAYREHVRTPLGGSPWLFLTKGRSFIKPSAMSKLVQSEWQRHSDDMGIPLPRLTASKNRKLVITVHREGGATREQQVALAKHMAHNVTTADRYYDKSDQREARHECLDDIQTIIMSSAGAQAVAGPSGLLPHAVSSEEDPIQDQSLAEQGIDE